MANKNAIPVPTQEREFKSVEEIDLAMKKLERRISELVFLNVQEAVLSNNGADDVATSNIRATIRDVFGPNSPEFKEHSHLEIWVGPVLGGMQQAAIVDAKRRGVVQTLGILKGLVGRLREKREDISAVAAPAAVPDPSTYFDLLNLHPRILEVSRDRFLDGYPWDAVFAAAKALINYVKDRSNRQDLDGVSLMTT